MEIRVQRAGVSTKHKSPMGYISTPSGSVYTTFESTLIRRIEELDLQEGDTVEIQTEQVKKKDGSTFTNLTAIEKIIHDEHTERQEIGKYDPEVFTEEKEELKQNDYAKGQELGNARQCASRVMQGLLEAGYYNPAKQDEAMVMARFDGLVREILRSGK